MPTPRKANPKQKASPPPRDSKSWKAPFLAALRNSGNIRASAQAARVARQNVYAERDLDPAFALAWDEAKEEAIELLEAACRQRALKGSDILMMFLLKAAKPDVYRETRDVKVTGKLDQEIVVDLVSIQADRDD